jgi:probable rRNA maturation factor
MTQILSLRSRQRVHPLNILCLRRITRHVIEQEMNVRDYELGLHFVSAGEMARVNEQFLQHEGSTDVITFDYNETSAVERLHGEIFISIADAVKQAHEFQTTWQAEVVRYMIHGLLHLRGYDDLEPAKRRQMKREENRLVQHVGKQFDLKTLARSRKS